jgi:hypothetical protein
MPRATRHELDGVVANVELTLISIVQGVALSYLGEAARPALTEPRPALVPYVVCGLTVVFMAWSRTVLHALTVIRWPLELGHNFLYLASALFEVVLFTELANPGRWVALAAAYLTLVWITFLYDLRLLDGSGGPAAARLAEVLRRDQLLHVRAIIPLAIAACAACAFAVHRWPALFVDRGWHVALAIGQAAGFAGYLAFTVRFYRGVSDLVVAARAEPPEVDGSV